jgi:toluene methyl-monooxygenase electron transfer component
MMRLFKPTAPLYNLSIEGTDLEAPVKKGQTILDAAIAADIRFPNMCAVGECGTCRCQVTQGQVKLKRDITRHIPIEEIREGHVLACQSVAMSELQVAVPGFGTEQTLTSTAGTIRSLERLTHDIFRVQLKLEQPVAYVAGQYGSLSIPGNKELEATPRHYSFAGAVSGEGTVSPSFFIRHVPGGEFTDWLFAEDRTGKRIQFDGPYGDFYYRESERPILCFAGGSGLAPIKALLQQMRADGQCRPVTLFFGARQREDLYWQDGLAQLAANWPEPFHYLPVLSEEAADSPWQGRRGFITEHLAAEVDDPGACDAYLCGPPPMLDAIIPLLEQAIPSQRIHFDKFLDKASLASLENGNPISADAA